MGLSGLLLQHYFKEGLVNPCSRSLKIRRIARVRYSAADDTPGVQAWLKGGTVGVVEATDAQGAMVVAVLDDQAAVLDTLRHQRPSSMVYAKNSKAMYSNTVATVRQTRCASPWRRSNSLLD
jgi:hypothetical protein